MDIGAGFDYEEEVAIDGDTLIIKDELDHLQKQIDDYELSYDRSVVIASELLAEFREIGLATKAGVNGPLTEWVQQYCSHSS